MSRYATKQDAIEQAIIPALDNPDLYDIDAIAAEVFAYRVDVNDQSQELLNTAGFEQIVSDDDFWAIVAKHEV